MKYEPVIGLEIHIQLNTKRKMFCFCKNDIWQKEPNSVTCPTCLALPGGMPVANKKAIKMCQMLGIATGCNLLKKSKFDRKHYFYPDLPKGYQITQYEEPFCENGNIKLSFGDVRVRRIHMEEDTGKSTHDNLTNSTLLNYNKSGVPLVELVSEPDMHSAEEAFEFAKQIAKIATEIGITNGNMQKGNIRLEPSISLRPEGNKDLPNYRVEMKNINSFKFMKDAIKYEIKRQTKLLEKGEKIPQETRGWNEEKRISVEQRKKEIEQEYRYFREPDIPNFYFDDDYIEEIKKSIPKTKTEEIAEIIQKHQLSKDKVNTLYEQNREELFNYLIKEQLDAKKAINKVLNLKLDDYNNNLANKEKYLKLLKEEGTKVLLKEEEIKPIVQNVLNANTKALEDLKNGDNKVIAFLMGQIMKESRGKADPSIATKLIKEQTN